jgi:hypothetical protein
VKAKELVEAFKTAPETEVRIAHINHLEVCDIVDIVVARPMNSVLEPHCFYLQVETNEADTKAWRLGKFPNERS